MEPESDGKPKVSWKYRRPPPRDKITDSRNQARQHLEEVGIDRVTGEIYPETGFEYGDNVRRLAYELWWLRADRNFARTARLLVEELGDELPRSPSAATIRLWAREENWVGKVEDDIKSVATILNERHFLRLFAASEQAGETLVTIALGEHPEADGRKLQVIKDAAVELLKLRGLGTAGGYAPPAIPTATARIDTSQKTPEELSQMIREAILQEKQVGTAKKRFPR